MKVFLVGGAVRDEIMGLTPKDKDYVVVGATPADIQKMMDDGFKQVGADFPVFLHPVTGEEWALARVERKTGNGYLGFDVKTEDVTLEEDLGRRDLTMNSIAKDIETGEYIDPFNGIADIRAGILRHTTQAFEEDPLRVIRLARFKARYDFDIAPETIGLAYRMVHAGELNHLSYERFWAELEKVLLEANGYDEQVDDFLYTLFHLGVHDHVNFFQEVFGFPHIPDHASLSWPIYAALLAPPQKRLTYFVALAARRPLNPTIKGMPETIIWHRKLLDLYIVLNASQVQANYSAPVNAMYAMLDYIKAWHTKGNTTFEDGIEFIKVVQRVSAMTHTFSVDKIVKCAEAVRAITAENFLHLKGKEIGDAIKAARLEAIRKII